jgi:hypothetical protein
MINHDRSPVHFRNTTEADEQLNVRTNITERGHEMQLMMEYMKNLDLKCNRILGTSKYSHVCHPPLMRPNNVVNVRW